MAKGRYNRIEAEIFLIGVYNETEKDPETALKMANRLAERYPKNQLFRLIELFTLLRAQRWDELIESGQGLLADVEKESAPFMADQIALIYLYLANASFGKMDYEGAIRWASKGIETSPDPERGWVTYCMLRRAMANDLLGRREEAVGEYKKVLKRDEFWFEHRDARKGKRKPYDYEKVMALILE